MPLSELPKFLFARLLLVFLIPSIAPVVIGQSLDISSPSPVRTNEIVGKITARDLGDSRLTDHFYAFTGTPGDVLITVKGNNLNGDVDVFTVSGLRPLIKFTLYAESTTPVTKSLFLRKREDLILRVEARTPNDDEGIYQIRLGGSFEPAAGEDLLAAADTPPAQPTIAASPTRGGVTRRVSSVGARIAEPPPPPQEEVATATLTPEPTPSPVETPTTIATPEPAAETEAPKPAPPRIARRGAGRRRPVPARPVDPLPEPAAQTGPRLIIEMLNGTRVEHFMNTLKRVTVENNQIVMVNKLGRIQRIFMIEVKRMSIEP